MSIWSKVGLLAGGFLFGTAGVKILASDDAKKAKDASVETAVRIRENCGDILADAKKINEERAAAKEQIFDEAHA